MKASFDNKVGTPASPGPSLTPAPKDLIQRKCGCGASSGVAGGCEECSKKRLSVQRFSADRPGPLAQPQTLASTPSLFGHNIGRVRVHNHLPQSAQAKLNDNQQGDRFEQEADSIAEQIVRASYGPASPQEPTAPSPNGGGTNRNSTGGKHSKSAQGDDVEETGAEPPLETPLTEPAAETASEETGPSGLIVEDEAAELSPGQMRKGDFLDLLQDSVCSTADAVLSVVGRSAEGCPYIEGWIAYYRTRSGSQVERAIRLYAPEAAGVTAARDYIPLINDRIRRGVATWALTGEITGIPAELQGQVSEGGGGETATGGASKAADVTRGIANLHFKAREGGPKDANPQQIQAQLGSGQPLDGKVKSRMESAFGQDFSRVRVHTDGNAAALASGLNARAFTVGKNIAFGAGEYQPGSLIGDALLAHEMAHVVQQGETTTAEPLHKGGSEYDSLEEDADRSAVGAVVSMWTGTKGALSGIAQNTMPALRSGLRLSRCNRQVDRKSVCIRPVRIANDDGSSPTTLPSFTESQNIWRKCCVDITVNAATTVSRTAFRELDESPTDTPSAEETSLFTAAGSGGSCISVFVPEIFQQDGRVSKDISGGGGTYDGNAADPKVVVVEGVHPTIVAHELGHAMGYGPHEPTGTVMMVSANSHSQEEPSVVASVICNTIRNFTSATSRGPRNCTTDT